MTLGDSDLEDLLVVDDRGLYCPKGDFYIDPWQPTTKALITHAHADHCYKGSERYIAQRHSAAIMEGRYSFAENKVDAIDYGESFQLGGVEVTFYPAGHILGSAQVLLEADGVRWLVSGDYKRHADPTAQQFQVVKADVLITEATFGLPIFKWAATDIVAQDIVAWWRACAAERRPALLYAYSLGKAQRLLASVHEVLANADGPGPVIIHPACDAITSYYQQVLACKLDCVSAEDPREIEDWQCALVIAPPSADGGRWIKRLTGASRAMASGWMALRGSRRRRAMDQGFVLSDHADWPSLVETCRQSEAQKIFVTHGYNKSLARYLSEELKVEAADLKSQYLGEAD